MSGGIAQETGPAAPSRPPPPPLLESLLTEHLDAGYRMVAEQRAAEAGGGRDPAVPAHRHSSSRRRGPSVPAVAGLMLAGLVLGIAAARTEGSASGTATARAALQADIGRAQTRQADLATHVADLQQQLRAAQSAVGTGGPFAAVRSAELLGAGTAVSGPGLSIVIDGPTAGSGGTVILDRDLQLLVNGLWSAGAEAVGVGGVRLKTTSAIRQAGTTILVDNRPAFWPITVVAIGDRSAMHVALAGTPGFARFTAFTSLYDIRFDITSSDTVTLPAAVGTDQRYARAVSSAATPATTTATTTAATTTAAAGIGTAGTGTGTGPAPGSSRPTTSTDQVPHPPAIPTATEPKR